MGNRAATEWLDERGFPPGLQVYATSTTLERRHWPGHRGGLIAYWNSASTPYTWQCWYCGRWHGYGDDQSRCESCNALRK